MYQVFCFVLLVLAILQLKTASSRHSQLRYINHLPPNLVPLKHDLKIYPEFENSEDLFQADVRITIRCEDETYSIVLNSKELFILEDKVIVSLQSDEPTDPIDIEDHMYDSTRDLYTIILEKSLEKNLIYEVFIPYKKEKSMYLEDIGYIQYEYSKESGKPNKVVVVTIADVNDLRRITPSFDLINLKSNFKLELGLPNYENSNLRGISSLTYIDKKPSTEKEGWTMATFEESLPISTYCFAFLVANLQPTSMTHEKAKVLITVWADVTVIETMEPTLILLFKVFDFYFEYFGSKPPIKSLDLVALPKFNEMKEMKTEKSGIILLDESTVLPANPLNHDTEADVILRMCYEVSRQWIGAGATVSQWNEYWLDMALVSFLRTICFNKLFSGKTKNPLDLELVETFTRVLRTDGEWIHPVYIGEMHFDLTKMFTESILSDKAYLIIRMMDHFFGENDFQKGVKQYFNQYNSDNSDLDKIWSIFNKIAEEANLLPEFATVKTVMESWTKKKGYALVSMERDFTQGMATLKQSRFVQLEEQGVVREFYDDTNSRIIPLSYVTKTQMKENVGKEIPAEIKWLKYSIPISPAPNELILVNVGMKGLFRVFYDKVSQKLISDTLKNVNEFRIIDDKTRASLICDMFALAAVEKVEYEMVFSTMTYLKNEDSEFPLMVALHEFNTFRSAIFDLKEEMLKHFEAYVKQILTPIFKREQFVKIDDLPIVRQELLLKKLVVESACTFQVDDCISQSKALFNKWRESDLPDKDNIIPEAIRETVFCQAMKHGGIDEFEFLWNQFDKTKERRFNEIVLAALGCFNQDDFLKLYTKH